MVEDSLHVGEVNLLGAGGLAGGLLAPGLARCIEDIDRRWVGRVSVQDVDCVVELRIQKSTVSPAKPEQNKAAYLRKVASRVRAVKWPISEC